MNIIDKTRFECDFVTFMGCPIMVDHPIFITYDSRKETFCASLDHEIYKHEDGWDYDDFFCIDRIDFNGCGDSKEEAIQALCDNMSGQEYYRREDIIYKGFGVVNETMYKFPIFFANPKIDQIFLAFQ